MTHRQEVKDRLLWTHDKSWYGFDNDRYYLKKAAPPEAIESFKKWAEYQDELGDEGYNYSLEIA